MSKRRAYVFTYSKNTFSCRINQFCHRTFCFFLIGLKLGGKTGLGTLMIVLFMGPLIQILYKIFDFDVYINKAQNFM